MRKLLLVLVALFIGTSAASVRAEKALTPPTHRHEVTLQQLNDFRLHGILIMPSGVDRFYNQTGGGAGTSCGSPHSVAQLNSNADNIQPGDFLNWCLTITTPVIIPVDGTSGSPVTILFQTGAKFSVPTLSTNAAAISKTSGNWLVIDGGVTCGWNGSTVIACNGTIEATANGSSPSFPNSNDFFGVHFPTCNHCEVRNLAINNLFVFNSSDTQGSCNAISIDAGSNNRSHNNTGHDMVTGIFYGMDNASNNEIDHNSFHRANWDYGGGAGGAPGTNFAIHDNEGYDWANWDDTSGPNSHHHNGIHTFVGGSGTTGSNDGLAYNNYFHGTTGCCTTAQIFIESPGDGNMSWQVFNNLFISDITASLWNNGYLGVHGSSVSHVTITADNNTLWASTLATQQIGFDFDSHTTLTSKNNLFDNARMGGSPGMTITAANNWYFNAAPFDWGGADTFPQWQSDCGCDANSSNGVDPNISLTTYAPNVGSPLITFGVNLNGIITALNSDRNGSPRPTVGAWTVGSLNSGAPPIPTTPTGILPPTLSAGTVGVTYPSTQLTVTGGKAPYTFTSTGMPSGMTVSSSGMVSGKPTIAGIYSPKAVATDANSKSVAQTYSLTITGSTPILPEKGTCTTVSPYTIDVNGVLTIGTGTTTCVKQ